MVPDCIIPPVNGTVRVDLRHHVGLSLGPAVDMTNWSPEDNLERSLCPASLADTLGLQRRAYWDELNPILKQWKNVNNSNCPDCQQFIKVNMGRHIRLKHSTYMCFWRCPVISCSLWFTAELNAKDHIEGIHKFQEGHGTSFYECLRRHGIEWFGSRTFFDQRKATNQAIWMDMALARRSGQELRNSYVITNSTEHAPLRRFFKAAVDALQLVFDRSLVTSVQPKWLLVQMREAVANCLMLDAAITASRPSRGNTSGGVVHGSGDAGRVFPRSHSPVVIVSGYSYYVNMLVTRLKSDMCLVFFCTINTFTLQLICHYLTSFLYGPPSCDMYIC